MAQRGDLVLVEERGEPIAGIVHLSGCDVAVAGAEGILRKPYNAITRAWRV